MLRFTSILRVHWLFGALIALFISSSVQAQTHVPERDEFVMTDEEPLPLVNIQDLIVYPEKAKEKGLEGQVVTDILLDTSGSVVRVEIEKSSNDIFNDAATSAMKKAKFSPVKSNGKPVMVWMTMPIVFRLNRGGASQVNTDQGDDGKPFVIDISNTPPSHDSVVAVLSPEQLMQYYLVYDFAPVKKLRTKLNSYIKKIEDGKDVATPRLSALTEANLPYLKSKFIVLSTTENEIGGYNITIMFQDKPDKVFMAWMYGEKRGTLVSFIELAMEPEKVKSLATYFGRFLKDKDHSR